MIHRFFTNNIPVKLLALAMAAVFWFFVLSSANTFYSFPDKLNIEPFNLPDGLAVVNELGTAQITVRASQDVYKTLTSENFTVYVDLKGLAAGSKQVDLSVNSKKTDVSVVSISPESIPVVLEDLTTKEVPLTFALEGEPAVNYEAVFSEPDAQSVTVSGAKSVLDKVNSAVATLVLQGDETFDVARSATISILDQEGEELTLITSSPAQIDLNARVSLMESQKTVGIKVLVGEIEAGFLDSIKVTPNVIQIQGDADVLDDILYLETAEINIPSGQEVYKTTVKLILPDGVKSADGQTSVEIVLTLNEN